MSHAKKSIVDAFSRAYAKASLDEQALLRVWMRDIIRPQKKPRVDVAKARRFEKDSVEARNRRILEFPVSMSHREVAKTLQAEGYFSLKTKRISIHGSPKLWAMPSNRCAELRFSPARLRMLG